MIEWIPVGTRVPDNRRNVLVWGHRTVITYRADSQFLGTTKFNPSSTGGRFDIERGGRWYHEKVSHWAEITPP